MLAIILSTYLKLIKKVIRQIKDLYFSTSKIFLLNDVKRNGFLNRFLDNKIKL